VTRYDHSNNGEKERLALLLGGAFLVYCLIAVTIGSPILGSDEYAYFISGKFNTGLTELYQRDPQLQRLPNLLFFKLIHLISNGTGAAFVPVFRLLHAVEYLLAALFLRQTFVGIVGERSAFWGTAAFLMLPGTLYLQTVMPETELLLCAAILGYLLIVVLPERPYVAALWSGLLLGSTLLVKPHAVAMLAAALLLLAIAFATRTVAGGRTVAAGTIVLLAGSCWLTSIILWRLCSGGWTFNPSVLLGLGFYGGYLKTQSSLTAILGRGVNVLRYALAHCAAVAVVFLPALWGAVALLADRWKTAERNRTMVLAALFVLVMLTVHIAMASYFTVGAAQLKADESMRLHGRYLGPVLSLLPFFYFFALKQSSEKSLRIMLALQLCLLLFCFGYLFRSYKLFPWDYPLLFAFFKAPNHYGWDYGARYALLGPLLLWGLVFGVAIALWRRQLARQVFFGQLFVILAVGCLQTYAWAYGHTRGSRPIVRSGQGVVALVGDQKPGRGTVVAADRYGTTSYLLFSLANAPGVLSRPAGSSIRADDVAGADWVICEQACQPEFFYARSLTIGTAMLFLINSDIRIETPEKKLLEPGRQAMLSPGTAQGAARPKGFNAPEEWGAWTARSVAEIELPFKVQGRVRLDLFGWTLAEHVGKPMSLRIGSAVVPLPLTGSAGHHPLTLQVPQPADRIVLTAPVARPPDSSREMGVAIGSITVNTIAH